MKGRIFTWIGAFGLALQSGALAPTAAEGQPGHLFVNLPAASFVTGSGTSTSVGANFGSLDRSCSSNFCELVSAADLSHGSGLLGIEIRACFDASNDGFLSFYIAEVHQDGSHTILAVREIPPNDAPTGCHYLTAAPVAPILVNQFGNTYVVGVGIGLPLCGGPPFPPCPTAQPRFVAVRVYYEAPDSGTVVPNQPSASAIFP